MISPGRQRYFWRDELPAVAARPEESLVLRQAARRPRAMAASIAAAVAAVSLAALALIGAAVPARAAGAAAGGVRYVALGDSYSSGLGAGYMISSSGACARSTKAYSRLWDLAHHPAAYQSVACAGATTSTVIATQLPALSAATTLVSITVGGNDAGFSATIKTCVLHPGGQCAAAIKAAEAKIAAQLPGKLNNVLRDIAGAAPNARVVVLGYPDLYDASRICLGLSTADRASLNQAATQLDAAIKAAAGRAGDTFADPRAAFAGHRICDSSPWLHSVSVGYISQSFHPTATGQADGYLPAFSRALAS
jgi:lysophospholipase L1-like esterase